MDVSSASTSSHSGGALELFDKHGHRFLSEQLLDASPPSMTWESFAKPLLRKFSRHDRNITWSSRAGQGREGGVWKAYFGEEGPFAVKVFWNTRSNEHRPRDYTWAYHWPFMRECRNVALLEKVRWAVENSDRPITVSANPKSREEKTKNLRCFSEDGRQDNLVFEDPAPMCSPAYMNRCYGWLEISREDLPYDFDKARLKGDPYYYEDVDHYYAVVYEYVSRGVQDLTVTKANLDFIRLSGFHLDMKKADNWRQGRLVDFGDILCPSDYIPPIFPPRPLDVNKFFPAGTKVKALD